MTMLQIFGSSCSISNSLLNRVFKKICSSSHNSNHSNTNHSNNSNRLLKVTIVRFRIKYNSWKYNLHNNRTYNLHNNTIFKYCSNRTSSLCRLKMKNTTNTNSRMNRSKKKIKIVKYNSNPKTNRSSSRSLISILES